MESGADASCTGQGFPKLLFLVYNTNMCWLPIKWQQLSVKQTSRCKSTWVTVFRPEVSGQVYEVLPAWVTSPMDHCAGAASRRGVGLGGPRTGFPHCQSPAISYASMDFGLCSLAWCCVSSSALSLGKTERLKKRLFSVQVQEAEAGLFLLKKDIFSLNQD